MAETELLALLLLGVFFIGGIGMVIGGILTRQKLRDPYSVEVDAKCVEVKKGTVQVGAGLNGKTHFYGAKRPVYRYQYQGQRYVSSPLTASNRKGYDPKSGPCTIRIDPRHPEKVYSPERKMISLCLIFIGVLWILVAAGGAILLRILLP